MLYNETSKRFDNTDAGVACMQTSVYTSQAVGGDVDPEDIRYERNGYDHEAME